TEDQLKSVSDIASAGWYVGAGGEATGANVAPGAKVDFSNTDGNIEVARTGTNLTFDLNKDIDLGADGSVTTGDTVMNNSGLTVDDGTQSTMIEAGVVTVAGGTSTITIDGNAGTIGGLTNTTFDPDNFTSGQAATEDQLKSVSDIASAGWYVGAGGEATGANVAPGAKVDF